MRRRKDNRVKTLVQLHHSNILEIGIGEGFLASSSYVFKFATVVESNPENPAITKSGDRVWHCSSESIVYILNSITPLDFQRIKEYVTLNEDSEALRPPSADSMAARNGLCILVLLSRIDPLRCFPQFPLRHPAVKKDRDGEKRRPESQHPDESDTTSPTRRNYIHEHPRSCGGVVVRLLASHLGSISGGVAPGFSHEGIVPDDAADRRSLSKEPPRPGAPLAVENPFAGALAALPEATTKCETPPVAGLEPASRQGVVVVHLTRVPVREDELSCPSRGVGRAIKSPATPLPNANKLRYRMFRSRQLARISTVLRKSFLCSPSKQWMSLTTNVLPLSVILMITISVSDPGEVRIEQCQNASGIVWHDSNFRKSGNRAGSTRWEASSLTTTPPRPRGRSPCSTPLRTVTYREAKYDTMSRECSGVRTTCKTRSLHVHRVVLRHDGKMATDHELSGLFAPESSVTMEVLVYGAEAETRKWSRKLKTRTGLRLLESSSPTEANRVLSRRLSLPDVRTWEVVPDDAAGWRVFSGISRFPPTVAYQRCSIPTLRREKIEQDICLIALPVRAYPQSGKLFITRESRNPLGQQWEETSFLECSFTSALGMRR
ncbi:hypothetical protein PR048_014629 [Dryococelus australis]|uniref:Uncharacterized protein n=1 Tax=Dryococelus australis TaxID=614101 RepID=A0ABQ9HEX7_9NEOP|nr:hypothetical protein PR048_014629 [Dryococelus australis]